MSVMEIIQKRRSIRSYTDRPVEEEKLQAVLEAGRLAPSAMNKQEWQFYVVRNKDLRTRLVAACGGQKMVGEAPVVLVVGSREGGTMLCGQKRSSVDSSIAMSFMMLEATEQGLGTCWLGAFENDKVKQVLNIPEEISVVAVSPLGYAAEQPLPRPRKPMEEVAVFKD